MEWSHFSLNLHATMPETVLSILCGTWNLDSEEEMQMIFYKDGTGEVSLSRTPIFQLLLKYC